MVCAALVKRDHIGSQPSFIFAFFLDRSDHGLPCGGSLVACHSGFHGGTHARRHIFNRHQNIELEVGRFDFVSLPFRIKAVSQIIVLRVTDLLQCVGSDMMVRDYEPVCRNERAAAAGVESDAGLLQMLKPLRRRLELIFLLELFQWRRIEKPHPFVGNCRCTHCKSENEDGIRKKRAKCF